MNGAREGSFEVSKVRLADAPLVQMFRHSSGRSTGKILRSLSEKFGHSRPNEMRGLKI